MKKDGRAMRLVSERDPGARKLLSPIPVTPRRPAAPQGRAPVSSGWFSFSPGLHLRFKEEKTMRPKKLGRFVILPTLLTLLADIAGIGGVAGAQQVTLPLTQYEDLRARANPAAEALAPPPAPFALELADFDVTAGPV